MPLNVWLSHLESDKPSFALIFQAKIQDGRVSSNVAKCSFTKMHRRILKVKGVYTTAVQSNWSWKTNIPCPSLLQIGDVEMAVDDIQDIMSAILCNF